MSAEHLADIYQTLNRAPGSSKMAADIVVENLGEVIGNAEATSAYETRAKGRPMLLQNPQKESRARVSRKAVIARQNEDKLKRRGNRESRYERKLPGAVIQGLKYQTFVEIHALWVEYMSELLNLRTLSSVNGPLEAYITSHAVGMQTKLVKADFHGCRLAVKASKCPTLVGLTGIVIEEAANVFRIITPDDRVKVLPKQNSIFTFAIPLQPGQEEPQIQFELYGNQFRFRADDRASRKFKSKETIEL
ncbi:ribonuclease P protein subunit p29 [Ceratobasidium sp. AG-Ba]|nr:ribonuclease P protein subunit p29 [Ceratobasidium sp. AG-Ba]